MKIVSPNAKLWKQTDFHAHVAKCAKVCYKNEKVTDDVKFVEKLVKAGHISVLRHATLYYKIPASDFTTLNILDRFLSNSFNNIAHDERYVFVAVNGNTNYDYPYERKLLEDYRIDTLEAENIQSIFENIFRYTFYIQTQISTSRELNRVSPNNICEESTRYVEQGVICRPWWTDQNVIDDIDTIYTDKMADLYFDSCEVAFKDYNILLDSGIPKQDARGVLPLDTCTHVVYTYSIAEWRDIIDKRLYATTGMPHPNCREIMLKIKNLLEEEGHEF